MGPSVLGLKWSNSALSYCSFKLYLHIFNFLLYEHSKLTRCCFHSDKNCRSDHVLLCALFESLSLSLKMSLSPWSCAETQAELTAPAPAAVLAHSAPCLQFRVVHIGEDHVTTVVYQRWCVGLRSEHLFFLRACKKTRVSCVSIQGNTYIDYSLTNVCLHKWCIRTSLKQIKWRIVWRWETTFHLSSEDRLLLWLGGPC